MPDRDTGPSLAPTDTIRFRASDVPDLPDGTYTVTVRHEAVAGATALLDGTRSQSFVVAGPRFALSPDEVVGMFPPDGASGDFTLALPHVLLRRTSLPWERSPTTAARSAAATSTWLALLVLAEDEVRATLTATVADLVPAAGAAPAPGQPARRAEDDPAQAVRLIEIDAALADTLLPRLGELALLAGVREVVSAAAPSGEARAIVLANRLPVPDRRNHVHLVSLEALYAAPAAGQPGRPPGLQWVRAGRPGTVQLVSLAHWTFHCDAAGGHLDELLRGLKVGPFRLEAPTATTLDAGLGAAQAGAVPMTHHRADGQRTAAWFHGPLAVTAPEVTLSLPVRRADDLLLTEQRSGMADVSYAAAWTLGRMLALRDPAVAVPLAQWKRRTAQAALAARFIDLTLPQPVQASSPVFPLTGWFDRALGTLQALPFAYLVPDPALLRPETICLLQIDAQWLAALFDGAFAVDRHDARQAKDDEGLRAALPKPGDRSAVLLRSAAVAGWPDLVVDGRDAAGTSLERLRFERLARDTLIVVFKGRLAEAIVHPHPQAMHFALEADPSGEPWLPTRLLPTAGGRPPVNGLKVQMRDAKRRVVDLEATLAAAPAWIGVAGSHALLSGLVATVPRHTYGLKERWDVVP